MVYKPTDRNENCSVDELEDLVNLLPGKGLGSWESYHLPLPHLADSERARLSPWGRREPGRGCVPEGLAVPLDALMGKIPSEEEESIVW